MRITLQLLMLIALVLFAVPAAAYESEDGSFQTEVRRVETECPFSLPEDEVLNKTVVCGELTVPENWENPGAQEVPISYAILKSPSLSPFPDPAHPAGCGSASEEWG